MKRFAPWIALSALSLSTAALADLPTQPIRVQAGFIGAFAPGTVNGYGIGAVAEPKLAITEQLLVGLRVEGVAIYAINIGDAQNTSASLRINVASLAKGEYAFTDGDVRPFIGLGAGLYTLVGTSGGSTGGGISANINTFGVAPQLGINLGDFRIAGLYHVVPAQMGANYFTLELSGTTFRF